MAENGFREREFNLTPMDLSRDFTHTEFSGTCGDPTANTVTRYTSVAEGAARIGGKKTSDVVTKNFRKLMSEGKIINNPFDSVMTLKTETLSPFCTDISWYYTDYNCVPPRDVVYAWRREGVRPAGDWILQDLEALQYAPIPDINLTGLIDQAVTQAWANATQSKAAALVMLGEGKETISGMCGIIARLCRVILAIKRLDLQGLKKELTPKELKARYMEARYMLRPLYYDTKAIIAAINDVDDYVRQTYRGFAKDQGTYTSSPFRVDSPDYNSDAIFAIETIQREVKVRAGVLCQVEKPPTWEIWGVASVFESAWELIPYSFIIDWIFNVGNTIAAWTPNVGVKPLASWYSVSDTIVRTMRVNYVEPYYSWFNYVDRVCTVDNAVKSLIRKHKYRIPDPRRSVLPSFNLRLNVLKLVDLLVIAQQLYSKLWI